MVVHFATLRRRSLPIGSWFLLCLCLLALSICPPASALTDTDDINSIVECRVLIASAPTDPQNYITASQAAQRLGDMEAAVEFLEDGRKRAEPSAELLLQLGKVYAALNRIGDAEAALAAALTIDPDFVDAHLQMGEICNRMGRHETAMKHFEHCLSLEPGNEAAQVHLLYTLMAAGRPQEAEEKCLRFVSKDRSRADLWLAMAEALEKQERLQDAFACYGHVLSVDPESAAAHSRRGRLYCRFGQFEEAAVECRAALELDPDNGLAHAYLGIACAQLGQKDEARKHAMKAEAAGMHMDSVWKQLGR